MYLFKNLVTRSVEIVNTDIKKCSTQRFKINLQIRYEGRKFVNC